MCRYIALAVFIWSCCRLTEAQTLAEVLQLHHVATAGLQVEELRRPITSFATSEDARAPFLVAYYEREGADILPPDMHVLRYSPAAQQWQETDLRGEELPFAGFEAVSSKLPHTCMGSVNSITERESVITIDTHINPSAGCILILGSDLRFKTALWGWTLARLRDAVLYEGAMVHFAQVHAGTLFLYELRQAKTVKLYPQVPDPEREKFSSELREYMPTQQRCMEQNLECTPAHFSSDLSNVRVNKAQNRIDMDVRMTAEGFGADAEDNVEPKTVHYTYTRDPNGWHGIAP